MRKRIKSLDEFIFESTRVSANHLLKYLDLIKKKIGSRNYEVIPDKNENSLTIQYDTGLTLLIKNDSIIGYNTDNSDEFVELPKNINSFKDLEKNIKILSVMKGKPKSSKELIKDKSSKEVPIIDLSKYGIKELKDGLTLEIIQTKFPWLLKAIIKDAVLSITKTTKNLIWEDGIWIRGNWEDGIWIDGIWEYGIWFGGTWKNGTWKNGTWMNGTWYGGTWEGGTWEGGTWDDDDWEGDTWKGGLG